VMRKPNPVLGVLGGCIMATLFSGMAVMAYAIGDGQAFDRLGVSLGSTLALYFAGGIVGGLLVGLLFPLTTWRWGSVVVGILAALPVYLGANLLIGLEDVMVGIFLATIVGGAVGYQVWSPYQTSSADESEG
jgi:hypothetical protein